MSYARWGCDGSDVYVYKSGDAWVCMCERGIDGHQAHTADAMLAHLLAHREAGDCVPESALERLRGDIAAGGYRRDW